MILSALAAATIIAACPWPERGLDVFTGDVPAAVDTYTDIPAPVRSALKAKMASHKYDDIAHITGVGISSKDWTYGPLTMMHFGDGRKICRTVDTSMWSEKDPGERALIYCVEGYCIAVPTVCRNVSRIERIGPRYAGLRMSLFTWKFEQPQQPPEVALPPIEFGPDELDLPRQPFSILAGPEEQRTPGDGEEGQVIEPRWTRISADQSFYDLWQWRPLFGPILSLSKLAPPVIGEDGRMRIPPVIGEGVVIVKPIDPEKPAPNLPADSPVFGQPGEPPKAPNVDAIGGGGSVAPIPEPGTYAMWLIGLAMLWIGVRRKRA